MAWYNKLFSSSKTVEKSAVKLGRRQQMFLRRVGLVNNYDDNTRTYIERGYQQNPIVYGIVNNIVKHAGRATWCVKDKDGNEIDVPLLSSILVQPNPLQSWTDFVQDALTHKILEGNMFITGDYGRGINSSKYNSLFSLPSERMQILATNDYKAIRGYKVDFAWGNEEEITASDVLHLKNPNPDYDETDNWLFGQSNFRAASVAIQTYNESSDSGLWFLQNKGSQKILMTGSDMDLSPEAADQLKDKIRAGAQGAKNNANIPIIEGELEAIDVSSNASDLLVLEQRDKAALEICNVVGYPAQLLGLKDATYQNAKEAKKALWEGCIIPELNELKDGLNKWLAPKYGEVYIDYKLDHIDALQEDKLMRGKAIKEFAGMVTVNEAREMAGLKPIDGDKGNEMYVGFTQRVETDESAEVEDVSSDKWDNWYENNTD